MDDNDDFNRMADDIDRIDAEVDARLSPAELKLRYQVILLCIEVEAYLHDRAGGPGNPASSEGN